MFDFGGPFFGWAVAIGVLVLAAVLFYALMRQRRQTPGEHAAGERGAARLYEQPEPLDPKRK